MSKLIPIEHNGQRVLTTSQLADAFGTETKIITNNFSRNKERYTEGKHYFELRGDALEKFKASHQIDANLKYAPVLYLWTEKGAWMHAKSLNTDRAWEAYEMLVDEYYRVKELVEPQIDISKLSPELQMFKQLWDGLAKTQLEQAETRKQLAEVQNTVAAIKETIVRRDDDWRDSINKMLNTAAMRSGGNYQELRSESYRILEERARCDLNTRLRNLRDRLEENGATKTKINNTTKMDVIEADPRLKEIYTTIVKELSINSIP